MQREHDNYLIGLFPAGQNIMRELYWMLRETLSIQYFLLGVSSCLGKVVALVCLPSDRPFLLNHHLDSLQLEQIVLNAELQGVVGAMSVLEYFSGTWSGGCVQQDHQGLHLKTSFWSSSTALELFVCFLIRATFCLPSPFGGRQTSLRPPKSKIRDNFCIVIWPLRKTFAK